MEKKTTERKAKVTIDPFAEMQNDLDTVEGKANQADPNRIPFQATADHTNIPLWTPLNKMIGPLHPANARITMRRWKAAGFPLYLRKRTEEEVEAFKQTDFYKKEHEKHIATRKLRRQQSTKGKQEKMISEVAAEVAKAVKNA